MRSAVLVKSKLNNWFITMTGSRQGSQRPLELPVESEGWSYSHQISGAKSDKEIKSLRIITSFGGASSSDVPSRVAVSHGK